MWFTENPWPPIIGLCLIGVLLFLVWLSQRKTAFLVGACLCVALCGVVWLVEEQIVTDREQVEQRLLDFAATFQRESLQQGIANAILGGPEPQTLSFISASANEVRGLAMSGLQLVDVQDDFRISDVTTTLTNNNSRAIVHFRASATILVGGYGNIGRQPTRWELTWQREQGQWKVVRATRLHFLTGEPLQNPLSSHE